MTAYKLLFRAVMLNSIFGKFSLYFGFFLMVHSISHFFSGTISSDVSARANRNPSGGVESLTWDGGKKTEINLSAGQNSGLRMFWWNIHDGAVNDGAKTDFQNNLFVLTHSEAAPDVLSFAEYEPAALGDANISELAVLYPYHQDFPYPQGGNEGVGVYSKYPFVVSSIDSFGNRSLIIMKLHVNGKEIVFSPVHIEDQWKAVRKQDGSLKTVEQVLVGRHNPIYEQVVQFRTGLEVRLGERLGEKNFVMMGDFNSPKPSRNYDKMGWDLHDPIEGLSPTFPALGSDYRNSYPISMQIDHIFVSPETNVLSAQILPLLGSDHYALYMTIDPN
jgi:endonuclease/exonuclease/phosphatase family metal-dependent hydrolase